MMRRSALGAKLVVLIAPQRAPRASRDAAVCDAVGWDNYSGALL